ERGEVGVDRRVAGESETGARERSSSCKRTKSHCSIPPKRLSVTVAPVPTPARRRVSKEAVNRLSRETTRSGPGRQAQISRICKKSALPKARPHNPVQHFVRESHRVPLPPDHPVGAVH